MGPERALERPFPLGRRGGLVVALVLVGLLAAWRLHLSPAGLVPGEGGLQIAREFLGAALHPAATYEASFVPAGAGPFLLRVLGGLVRTLLFAAAAMGLALPLGLVLGFLASAHWWAGEEGGRRTRLAPWIQGTTRAFVIGLRSVHELLWAIVFLAAFGLSPASACLAIALPYAGTLAKVFSEVLDEAPSDGAAGVRATGAGPVATFLVGVLPRALPDMAAYAFYRFECAVRSSAVLGFFGFETLGYYLAASFENVHYREVWTYLYALFALVVALELWSSALRRRFLA